MAGNLFQPQPTRTGVVWRIRLRLKCDGTRAETKFRLSAKRTSPVKSAGESVQSTIGSRGVRISGSNGGYTMFRISVKGTGYPLHSSVSPSLPLPCVTVRHHISTGLYHSGFLKHSVFNMFILCRTRNSQVLSLEGVKGCNAHRLNKCEVLSRGTYFDKGGDCFTVALRGTWMS